jgi:Questin oxidase-like
VENWRDHLGRAEFSRYIEFFDGWTKQDAVEAVLKDCVSVLMKGVSTVAYHALLRLAYAIDYGNREEVAFSLAYWASAFYPGPTFDDKSTRVEPDAFFADIIASASRLQIEPTNSIDGRIVQVYRSKEVAKLWKPIRIPDSNALEKMSALILETFVQSQHFTLLHALTSCQALRFVLPYLSDPKNSLSHYWHSVCAAYITVHRCRFEVGKDTAPSGDLRWQEVFARASASDPAQPSFEHTIKLTYTCWLEFQHYKREQYLALASREFRKPSSFV